MNWSKRVPLKHLRPSFAAALLLWLLIWGAAPRVAAADDFAELSAAIRAANSSGSRAVTLSGDITLSAALPPIAGELVVDGGGHTISGDGKYRIFDVDGGALTLSNVSLTKGRAGEGAGGALRMRNGAEVTIERSTFSANSAAHGGAVATSNSGDQLAISDSRFVANIADKSAGAIYAKGGTLHIRNSSFEKNCALRATFTLVSQGRDKDTRRVDDDGCIHVDYVRREVDADLQSEVGGGAIRLQNGARAGIEGSTFHENAATYGGAIVTASSNIRLTVSGSSFVGNRSSDSGGAIGSTWLGGGMVSIGGSSFVENSAEGDGGAIDAVNHTLDIANSTFSENYADGDGGAVRIDEDAAVTITHATFAGNKTHRHVAKAISNTGGKAYLRNSIMVSGGIGEDCVGVWTQNRGNLSPDGTCADRPSDDPRLGGLTGSPAYYPLRDRSPAVDYADAEFCLEADQVGRSRPQGGGCDIGAIEERDAVAADPTPIPPLVCSLAHQIIAANHDRRSSGCPAGSGVDTISLDKDIILFEPLPAITSHIIIEGNGYSISGNGKYRIFDVDGGTLTVKNLTMTEGYSAADNGGAIRLLNGGRAVVNDSRFTRNTARLGGAAYIGWQGTDRSRLTLNRTRLTENRARSDANGGGAIYAGGGAITVNNSSFVNNSAGFGKGSAILMVNPRSRLDIANSSVISRGSTSLLAVENGVIVTLTHATIYGPYAVDGALHTTDSEFDPPGKYNLRNSIIVGSLSPAVCDNLRQNIGNLIEDGSCSPRLSGDPGLAEATDSSTYLELLPGSAAIGSADARFCPESDQLGRPRALVGRCDIGAIEAVPVSQALSDCRVTTTHMLNFRDGPGGNVIGGVPQQATLSALARTPRWFEVEHEGASGWISADYVQMAGECG